MRHKTDRLRCCPVRDKRTTHVQVVVPIEVNLRSSLDGKRVTWRDADIAVQDVGLVICPHHIFSHRAAEVLIAAACGDGEGNRRCIRAVICAYGESERYSVTVTSASCHCESIDRITHPTRAGDQIAVPCCSLLNRHQGINRSQLAGNTHCIPPVIA
ncbi:MAG: hypothetical protein BWY63_01653 [Chloroflexi bacterium ADurb.Bin360]|nr:MAG: hypothetical protein BWY63_01653 [Chloroflexi bacterium ADurb.Bin360]